MRRVNREIIDTWISQNYPDAVTKLATASGVPATSIAKIRCGRVPKSLDQRIDLAKSLGVDEEALFPTVKGNAEQAS